LIRGKPADAAREKVSGRIRPGLKTIAAITREQTA
jgi:hypothetical protein